MLTTDEELERFTQFTTAGGLKPARTLTKGLELITKAPPIGTQFSECVSTDADYTRDGLQGLAAIINDLSSELHACAPALAAWNSYIQLASNPTDLEQVAQGVSIRCKLDKVADDKPSPSIIPIIQDAELLTLEQDVNLYSEQVQATIGIMSEVNAILVQPEPEPSTDSSDSSSGSSTPPVVIPPMPPALITRAKDHEKQLRELKGKVLIAATKIGDMAESAAKSRSDALALFQQAVKFTVCNNQINRPSIGLATREIFEV